MIELEGKRVRPAEEVLVQALPNGEAVLLHQGVETYSGLDPVGARMWTVLASSPNVAAAVDALLREFDVHRDHLEADIVAFIAELVDARLMEVQDA